MAVLYPDGFDSHTHLDFPEFDLDRESVVDRARASGVERWVIAGSDHDDWDRTVRIAAETGGIAILGIHPWAAATLAPALLAPLLEQLSSRNILGIGEIGLDALHAKDASSRERQRQALRAQLAVARERDLPVAFHCVRAYPELVKLLETDGVPRAGGMMHAWSGPPELIARVLALGLHVSFAPLILRDRARKARASVPHVPDDRLLIETDCPNMMALGATRGEPSHLVDVAVEVARLRGQDTFAVWNAASANARRLWRVG
jgi:TatD DNase family protein